MFVAKTRRCHVEETYRDQNVVVGDFLTVARSLSRYAVTIAALAGQAPHLTAISNAQTALADARQRAEERREVAALFAAAAATRTADGPVTTGGRSSGR
jgi:hypothetical protein